MGKEKDTIRCAVIGKNTIIIRHETKYHCLEYHGTKYSYHVIAIFPFIYSLTVQNVELIRKRYSTSPVVSFRLACMNLENNPENPLKPLNTSHGPEFNADPSIV